MSLKSDLNRLALKLVSDALAPMKNSDLTPKDRVDIFKAATQWQLGSIRAAKKEPDDDLKAGTFESLRRDVLNGEESIQ
jgi:hypothetical protein